MKISVIIPCYNGEKYIEKCLEHVVCQTYKNLEIIVINDGSKDGSLEIIEKFKSEKFKNLIIVNQENRGLSVARNTGIDCATGDYIHFMDADDFINLQYYEKMAEAILSTNADIACGGMVNERKPHRTVLFPKQLELLSVEEKMKVTNVGKRGYACRYLFKIAFLKAHNLSFEEGRFIEDIPFSLAAVYFANKVVTVPDAVYTYVFHENSIMTEKDRAHRKKRHQDMRHTKELRHNFARKYGFKIPGVPTGNIFSLFFVKWFT